MSWDCRQWTVSISLFLAHEPTERLAAKVRRSSKLVAKWNHNEELENGLMTPTATKLITAKEFAMMPNPPDGSKQELVRGEIVTMPPPSFRHGECQLAIGSLLRQYVRANRLGRVTTESGLRTESDPDTVRGPDVAFWSAERLPLDQTPEVYPEVAADLCVEILSPSNTRAQIRDKIREYFRSNVRMVWIVDTDNRTVTVFRRAGAGQELRDDEMLTGEDVLPGFSCPVAEFFAS
jgi:Uma2 family endonuclease